jgi:predicted restriction endonuclease
MVKETPDEIEQNDIIRIYKNQNKTKEEILNELKNLKQTDLEEITIKGKTYKRDNKTIAQIKILRDFQCQICFTSIRKKDGSLYVEAAHVIAKHLRGRETVDNIILLCPNHHKEFDLGDLKIKKHDQDSIEFSLNGKEYCITFSFDLMTR